MRGFHRERGAMTITISIVLVALIAMGAFVFDWGALVHERRQLQNGADAAALDVAEACALEDCNDADPEALIDANASDEVNQLEALAIDFDDQTVAVDASSLDQEGRSIVRFFFGRLPFVGETLADDEGVTVQARAVAQWGGIGAASTIPLSLPECVWEEATNSGASLPSSTVTITFHDAAQESGSCLSGPAGQIVPGNWGWLETVEPCLAETSAGATFDGLPGNRPPHNPNIGCDPSDFPLGEPILFPIFDQADGTGNNAQYHVIGYGAFELEGYKLHSSQNWTNPNNYSCGPGAPGGPQSTLCMTGKFVAFVALDAVLGAPDLGARTVTLIE